MEIWTIPNILIFLGIGAGVSLSYFGVEKLKGVITATV
jgi:hypothetical protein